MEKKIIELKNISKNFEDQQVLKGIDLNIYELSVVSRNQVMVS